MISLPNILTSQTINMTISVIRLREVIYANLWFILVIMYRCESWTIRKAKKAKEILFSNCGAGDDSWESLRLQGDQTSQSYRKSILNIHWKDWSWSYNTLATRCEEPTHWKRLWCWERQRAGGDGETEEMFQWHHRFNAHDWANSRS